ncbi:DUF3368 domain-containing protein [Gillisia limnaea]|uniref:DUF3368 domain-containing protein n=1 Tax=Gillisia limnaea (strain DSM 15749 / LMG 21470 / R-8282) TaxID=865937 RepID=H2BVA7_GILLR|nr:DUF3368 domain-containing protein [Gillisia limnaea]EHQ01772.1 hypothetical protein Gilli_1098 [Gillisia limnaea DSM 15749]
MQLSSNLILDTSCLIILSKIEELELLRGISNKIYVTPVIHSEYGQPLPEWVLVSKPENTQYQKILELDLDQGEASAIALSMEIQDSILILDELKGRKIAERLNLKFSGTFGVILKAKQTGLIKSVKPVIDKI